MPSRLLQRIVDDAVLLRRCGSFASLMLHGLLKQLTNVRVRVSETTQVVRGANMRHVKNEKLNGDSRDVSRRTTV